MKQKKNVENTFDLGVDKTKVNLIRHFMAEKGLESEQFDKEFTASVNKLVDKMYNKYVPKEIRKLLETPAVTLSINPVAANKQLEEKGDRNGQGETVRTDTEQV